LCLRRKSGVEARYHVQAMVAAIYCRKSTDQSDVTDEQRSVARQVEHARAFALKHGWLVDDAHVYVDDGMSGAEFERRPAFLRLMNSLKPRAPFQVLVMAEESRLGREAIETAYALKQLLSAGVRVWFYLEGRERTLDGPTDKLLMSVAAFADELERERARQRTYDAMQRKAKAGHVTGGRVFGYDNVDVRDSAGHRSHVRARRRHARSADGRRPGARPRCARCSTASSIAAWWCGTSRRSATPGGAIGSTRARRPSGSGSTRLNCGLCPRRSGKPFTS
jgi:DNA invertase Pin-like site-specific DNA recombinase